MTLIAPKAGFRGQLNRFPMTSKTGHTALDIGLRDEVERHLNSQPKEDRNEQCIDDQFRFRLARMDGIRNPYKKLLPNCHHEAATAALLRTPPETKHP